MVEEAEARGEPFGLAGGGAPVTRVPPCQHGAVLPNHLLRGAVRSVRLDSGVGSRAVSERLLVGVEGGRQTKIGVRSPRHL